MPNTVACSDCGVTISQFAVLCPHCGRQYKALWVEKPGLSTAIMWGALMAVLLPLLVVGFFFMMIIGSMVRR